MKKKLTFDLSSASLHLLAMVLMLCDHLWATIIPGNQWLNSIGRLAFPIFAFLIAEGCSHTHDPKKYALRLLICAVLAEIPFNLMYGGSPFYPFHQNVLWTLLLGMLLIQLNEYSRKKHKLWLRIIIALSSILLGYVLGFLTMLDYYGAGVVTVLVFYFFRKKKWWCFAGQFIALYFLNIKVLGGLELNFTLFGHSFTVLQQSLALFSLIPIWLYQGRKGFYGKPFRIFCYIFYPAHMLILYAVGTLFL